MKKYLLSALFLLNACLAQAATISLHTISADSAASVHNSNFTTLANTLNGETEGSTDGGSTVANIKADSIYEINMADDANPRLRDSELFNITTDSVSAGNLTQGAVVESGCVPATDTDLTSDISACVAYVNGYRISKSATAQTYTASRDTYVDLSQTGVYTLSAVTNGAAQPSVAANSVRLAKVVTDGTQITSVTSLYTTRVPGLIIPANYRDGLFVSRDSSTTVSVLPGSCEVNNSMITKTSTTTLTLTTAGDWAGGSSLQAINTAGFVGVDSSGNIKLHTTAPTHDNYAVSTTAGKKRYATWSSTVYRILGWFWMNSVSSGTLSADSAVSNIRDGNVPNSIFVTGTNNASTAATNAEDLMEIRYFSSGFPSRAYLTGPFGLSTGSAGYVSISNDTSTTLLAKSRILVNSTNPSISSSSLQSQFTAPQGVQHIKVKIAADSGSTLEQHGNTLGARTLIVEEV